jgi:hypothetical protein
MRSRLLTDSVALAPRGSPNTDARLERNIFVLLTAAAKIPQTARDRLVVGQDL